MIPQGTVAHMAPEGGSQWEVGRHIGPNVLHSAVHSHCTKRIIRLNAFPFDRKRVKTCGRRTRQGQHSDR